MPRPKKNKNRINTKNHMNVFFDVDKKKESIRKRLDILKTKELKIEFLKLNINTYYCMSNKLISRETEQRNVQVAKYCEKLLKEIK